jgi:hypothetical protein
MTTPLVSGIIDVIKDAIDDDDLREEIYSGIINVLVDVGSRDLADYEGGEDVAFDRALEAYDTAASDMMETDEDDDVWDDQDHTGF